MNYWTKLSIEYANQKSYLDDLFKVYPTIPNGIRDIDNKIWENIKTSFNNQNNKKLIENLLKLDLFPIKDSYIAYLRKDKTAIDRNPETIDRLAGRIYDMGIDEVYKQCTKPKETNRQIGPMFKEWVNKGVLGKKPIEIDEFINTENNAILSGSDQEMEEFAEDYCDYEYAGNTKKGLDFIARFNKKYVIGEAKFLTDIGGHQNAQFNDALNVLDSNVSEKVTKIAILDGVLYIKNERTKMYRTTVQKNDNIMSALILNEFLYSI
ncbi:restriction endonuclease [Methanobrevibacter sp. AbM4]|uniref:restriction endonuclease n=1 Tax=Methanobrevibacter sp. AbM4 TaxID=224719 RepID=UPI00064ED5B1|nr:restriction endonuclease [Methanobrevibacter sp. AbM4]